MLKVKKKLFLLLSSLLMVIGWLVGNQPVFAQDGNGGQVQTNGEIIFYEDEPEPSSSQPPVSSSSEAPVPSTPSSEPPVTKPPGKYPSTGELVKKSLSISGGVLILIAFFLFLYKRRKKEADQ